MDFSGKSRQALKAAVPLAEHYGGKISLIHAVEPVYRAAAFPGEMGITSVDTRQVVEACEEELSALARKLVPRDLLGETMVRTGRAYVEIINAADELEADLIALSTHGYTGLKHVMLGSTAEHVVRHAHCPVLTLRRGPEATPGDALKAAGDRLPWRGILVPLDFSLTSLCALDVAARLAHDSGARLLLLHVIEPTPYATGMDGAALAIPDSVLAERAKAALPRIARRLIPPPVRVVTLVARGRAAKTIAQTASAGEMDLIVVSTHGHTGFERFMMGSTAEQVVRQAACPVFVVRSFRRNDKK